MLKLLILLGFVAVYCGGTTTPSKTEIFKVGDVEFKMIGVAAGTFLMGAQADDFTSENYDNDAYQFEGPVHKVTLTNDYYIGETAVTQALWTAVMGSNPSHFQSSRYPAYSSRDNYPVEMVSWDDIVGTSGEVGYVINGVTYYQNGFCYKLSQLVGGGKQFRLPTEAEWEYAARGGAGIPDCPCKSGGRTPNSGVTSNQTRYSGSNNINEVAWYNGNIPSKTSGTSGYGTQEVKTKQPNASGIYDMSGNVFEWCSDIWEIYTDGDKTDPTSMNIDSPRVLRGGSWDDDTRNCRVYYRTDYSEDNGGYRFIGFRLVLSSE